MSEKQFDFVVIGSGFGGSVSAMRLVQKGYRVALIEMGRDYKNADFPKSNWNIRKYLWAPRLFCYGIQKISFFKKLMVLHGVGVGGGSLVYANTLMSPNENIFDGQLWPSSVDWKNELRPFYLLAKKMLGVVTNPVIRANENAIKKTSELLHCGNTFHPTEVGVFFGNRPGDPNQPEVQDPYFSGQGPSRTPCSACGSCMIGCPTGAKNSLDKNYLFFARKWGAQIFPELKVEKIIPNPDGSYLVTTFKSTGFLKLPSSSFKTSKVIISAGVMGTLDLLFRNRDCYNTLPHISKQLGFGVRTNGESLLGVTTTLRNPDYSQGVAIGAAFHPDENTKIEGVRYPSGSGLLRWLAVPLTGDGNFLIRPLLLCRNMVRHLGQNLKLLLVKDWARHSVILLVMQSIDSQLQLTLKRQWWWPFCKNLGVESNNNEVKSYIPVAQQACQVLSEVMNGTPQNIASEVLLQTPATAHILGGCLIGESAAEGVIDVNHQVFGHPGLYVCDASVIPTNLAVNPSLTITALSERFTSQFVSKASDHTINFDC